MPQSAKNSSQSWVNDEQLHLESYFKSGVSKSNGKNASKAQTSLKRKADSDNAIDNSSSSKKPRQAKEDTKGRAKENNGRITKKTYAKLNSRKALGDITDTAITQVNPLGSNFHKESPSEAKSCFTYTSREKPEGNATPYSKTVISSKIIDISDDADTIPDSEDEWLDDTTIVSKMTPAVLPKRTALFKRLGDLFPPTPPASISPMSRSNAQVPCGTLPTPIPMTSSSYGTKAGSQTSTLYGPYPTPMTDRPLPKTKAITAELAKIPSLESRNIYVSSLPKSPEAHVYKRSSLFFTPSEAQEIVSSQSQYLIPFIPSPKKGSGNREFVVPPSPSKDFQDVSDRSVSEFVIPSSQGEDSSVLLCQATQGNKFVTRKSRSPIRSAPIHEIPSSPSSTDNDQLLTGPSSNWRMLSHPSATQQSTTQPESQEFTFGRLSSPTPLPRNSQLSRRSDIVIDDSEDEDDMTIKMPFKSKSTESLTQPDSDDVFQTQHNSRDTLIAHSTNRMKLPIISTQESTTQPDYDEDDLFNFNDSQKTGYNRTAPVIKALDTQFSESTSITQDESQQSATFMPLQVERGNLSTSPLFSSPPVPRNDSQTEAISTAVREFFQMIATDDDFPESLLAIERQFAR